ncbi:MAG: Appr-1-p processing protein, partial [Deltaproteobacteria bacterium]|nr:Appr-1-p processing protein [Deltaproteobacteria bacterium]
VHCLQVENPLRLEFKADKYGPYSHKLSKLLDSLDGSYLHCDKRLADAGPFDLIWFNDAKEEHVNSYLTAGEGRVYAGVLEWASRVVDGFESPLGMELLATVDWLLEREGVEPTIAGVKKGLSSWAGGKTAGQRKLRLLNDRLIGIALDQLNETRVAAHS